MPFEYWLCLPSGREIVHLEFVPGSEFGLGDDWHANFIGMWRRARERGAYANRPHVIEYGERLVDDEHADHDWQTLALTVGKAAGILRVAGRRPGVYPDLRSLLAPESDDG